MSICISVIVAVILGVPVLSLVGVMGNASAEGDVSFTYEQSTYAQPQQSEPSVEYRWYDMFNTSLGEWYDWRYDYYGNWEPLTDSYPYLYRHTHQDFHPSSHVYSNMRLNVSARDLPSVNMNAWPEFLPLLGTERGGNASIDWYMQYLTLDEFLEKLPDMVDWYDGWFVSVNGTVTLDRQAAMAVLGLTSSDFDDFAAWWAVYESDIEAAFTQWLTDEGNSRLDIYAMYYDWWFEVFLNNLTAEKTDDTVVLTYDVITWGEDCLMARWLHEALLPGEWYMEDMFLHAKIGPESADLDIDTSIAKAVRAWEDPTSGIICWEWEPMLGDMYPGYVTHPSEYDPYWGASFYNRAPGGMAYHEWIPYSYTPCAFDLGPGENMTIEWPAGDQVFVRSLGGSDFELVSGTILLGHQEPSEADFPDNIIVNETSNKMAFVGPLDFYNWAETQTEYQYLADEWARVGELPYGIPYIEWVPNLGPSEFGLLVFDDVPSETYPGSAFNFTVMAMDQYGLPYENYTGTVSFSSTDSSATLPADYTYTEADGGVHEFSAVLVTVGYQCLAVQDVLLPDTYIESPAILVLPEIRGPILITADDEFTPENGVTGGSGTVDDPYMIEGWYIADWGNLIEISGTTAYFVISNVELNGMGGMDTHGIHLVNLTNGAVQNADIYMTYYGIYVAGSTNVMVCDSYLISNYFGVLFYNDFGCSAEGCYVQNYWGGIEAHQSAMITVTDNYVIYHDYGIYFAGSTGGTIVMNTVMSNSHGVYLLDTTGVTVNSNNIMYNYNYQGYDNFGDNLWNASYPTGGNYWTDYYGHDDYCGPNQDQPGSDGIGDTPYLVNGGDNTDYYPLMAFMDNHFPIADFTVTPAIGNLSTVFEFNASTTSDVEDPIDQLLFMWDWEGDGVWDTDWSSELLATHTYSEGGSYLATLEVMDTGSLVSTATHSVIVDVWAPTTVPGLSGDEGLNGWYTSDVNVVLDVQDDFSEIAYTMYRLNGGDWQEYTGPFVISGQGFNVLWTYSADAQGNIEPESTWYVNIDSTVPFTACTLDGFHPGYEFYFGSAVNMTLEAFDSMSGVSKTYFKLDTGLWYEYAGTFMFTGDGEHVVYYYSVDEAGNEEPSESVAFTIDRAGPRLTGWLSGQVGNNGWYVHDVQLTLEAEDLTGNVIVIYYTFDNIHFYEYETTYGPVFFSEEGFHTVMCYAVDQMYNYGPMKSFSYALDRTEPETVAALVGAMDPSGWFRNGVTVYLSSSDAVSGVASTMASVGGGAWLSIDTVVYSVSGTYTLQYYSEDFAGNVEDVHSIDIMVDVDLPEIAGFSSSSADEGYSFTYSVEDVGSGIERSEYRVDDGAWIDQGDDAEVAGLVNESGVHTVTVRVYDIAGNVHAASYTFGTASEAEADVLPMVAIVIAVVAIAIMILMFIRSGGLK